MHVTAIYMKTDCLQMTRKYTYTKGRERERERGGQKNAKNNICVTFSN